MRGNVPISEIPLGEDLWLMVLVTSVRERRTQQGRLFCDASARNATGSLTLKIWSEVLETQKEIGSWGVSGSTIEETAYAVLGLAAVFEMTERDLEHDRRYRYFAKAVHGALDKARQFMDQMPSSPNLWIGKSLYCVKPLVPILKAIAVSRIHQLNDPYCGQASVSEQKVAAVG